MSRIALVTGGTRGLGLAIAEALATAGHTPILGYHQDEAAAAAALTSIRTLAPRAVAWPVDIADPEAVEALATRAQAELGPIQILINNAFRSGRPPQKVHELSPSAWREDLATNLDGPFWVTRAALPQMIASGFGRVVFIGSLAARGEMGRAAYSTAKAALAGLAGTIAQEYARQGITANVISPGFIDAGAFLRLSPEIRERALKRVPSGRAGQASEVAALVTHVVSDAGGYLNGQVLSVDGGTR
ncbi:MAG: SDR family oxidoreductase [Deltaproteobacteria bacterium]|nr:SDR family oxidoreductase [Deltaproteobacteria bacterium]